MWEQQLLFSHLLLCMKQLCFVLPCHRQLILAKAGEAKQNSLQQAPRQQSQPYTLLQHYAATGCASCLLEGQPLQFWGWSPRKQGGSWGRTGEEGTAALSPLLTFMKGGVQEGVIKEQAATLSPALRLTPHHQLAVAGGLQTFGHKQRTEVGQFLQGAVPKHEQ